MKTILLFLLLFLGGSLKGQTTCFWFEPYFVKEFVYNSFNDQYMIEYFDEDSEGDCIKIEVSKELFFEVIDIYSKCPERLLSCYQVREVVSSTMDGTYRYSLVKVKTIDIMDPSCLYVPVQWPEIQELMDEEGFLENCHLINDTTGYQQFGDSAYMVNLKWLTEHQQK